MMTIKRLKTLTKKVLDRLQPKTMVHAQIAQLAPNDFLKGRCALITGGTSGIGFAIAKAFLNAGASVVITGRNQERLDKACAALGNSGRIYTCVFDNRDVNSIAITFQSILDKIHLGGVNHIDILVNNAGTSGCDIKNGTPEIFDNVIDTNLKGVFFLSQQVGKYMTDNKIHGNILNISSASSIRPAACAYTISKWGIRGFTLGLARTLLPYGITVNALAPGPVATPLLHKNGVDDDLSLPNTPYGRFALPEEIANMAVILVSPIARLIIGDTVFMTGGAGNVNNGDIDYPF